MATVNEVVKGLRKGLSYKRTISKGVEEWVRPVWHTYSITRGYTKFEHTVVGPNWGGVNEMDCYSLFNGRFAVDGWNETV